MLHESSLGPFSCTIDLLYFARWLGRETHHSNESIAPDSEKLPDQDATIAFDINDFPYSTTTNSVVR